MNKPCTSCYWCKITSVPDTCACYVECKYFTDKPDPVTGHRRLGNCSEIRKEKLNCPTWKQGGLKGFIKRLFR